MVQFRQNFLLMRHYERATQAALRIRYQNKKPKERTQQISVYLRFQLYRVTVRTYTKKRGKHL